ncbi:MAG: hypothetical protein ACK41O_27625, partial [Runella zeae]
MHCNPLLTFDDAMSMAQQRRPCVAPNSNFVTQLRKFQKRLQSRRRKQEE